ncbi:MAG: prenyltransferase [Methanomicrobiaceae archaeon]|nr:prenyltransferase [Methanomicrobiaceae archaeon]
MVIRDRYAISWLQAAALWIRLGRLPFLGAGVIAFLLGGLYAVVLGSPADAVRICFGYLILGCAHLSVSYSNEYFDRFGDLSGDPTPISGGSGVLRHHPSLAKPALHVACTLILLSIACAVAFAMVYHMPWWFLPFVLVGNAVGWWYSAPPVRLSSRGFGEAATAFTVGFLVPGMGYAVVAGTMDRTLALFLLPLLCLGLVFSLAVAVPDMESDRMSGKRTFIALFGREAGWQALIVPACLVPACYALLQVVTPSPATVDFTVLFAASLLLPAVAIYALFRRCRARSCSIRLAGLNVAAVIIFYCVADAYLCLLALGVV